MNGRMVLTFILSLSFWLSACDKNSNHRNNKPGKKAAGQLGAPGKINQKTQDGVLPTNTPKPGTDQNDTTDSDDTNPAAKDSKTKNTPSDLNVLDEAGASNSAHTNSRDSQHGDSQKVAAQKASDPKAAKTEDDENQLILRDLQKILSQLNTIYQNSWYTIVKDNSSRPKNFFEDLAAKMQNFGPILNLQKGEATPASIRQQCNKYRLAQLIDKSQNRRRLALFDCSTQQFANVLAFQASGTHWTLATTPQAMELILPNQLGYLSTISFKPICNVDIEKQGDAIYITQALCKDWGQELSAVRSRDRKTILFTSIKYDNRAEHVIETEAQYVDYDGSNQLCRSGVMKRKAPQSSDFIYMDDEGDGKCHPTPNPQEGNSQPAVQPPTSSTNNDENAQAPAPNKPRKKSADGSDNEDVINPRGESTEMPTPDPGGPLPVDPSEQQVDPSSLEQTPTDDTVNPSLPPDPTASHNLQAPSANPDEQNAALKEETQMLEFSSEAPANANESARETQP